MPFIFRTRFARLGIVLAASIIVVGSAHAAPAPGETDVTFNACPEGWSYVVGKDGLPYLSTELETGSAGPDLAVYIKDGATASLVGHQVSSNWTMEATLPAFGHEQLFQIVGSKHRLHIDVEFNAASTPLVLEQIVISDTNSLCP